MEWVAYFLMCMVSDMLRGSISVTVSHLLLTLYQPMMVRNMKEGYLLVRYCHSHQRYWYCI